MGWLKNVGKAIGKGVKDTGHAIGNAQNNKWVKAAEAAALTATGVGAPAAAAIMGGAGLVGGAIRSGGGLKGALTEGGQGALTGAAAGLVRPAAGLIKSGITSVGSKLLPHGSPATAPEQMYDSNGEPIAGTLPPGNPVSVVPAPGRSLPVVGSNSGGIDWGNLAKTGIAAGTAYEGYKANQQSEADRKKALDLAQSQYDQTAPLRSASIAKLSNVQRPDLSGLFADGNPYKKKLPQVGAYA